MKPYREILKLVWPLALGMVNNAVMQFVDRVYLAHDSMTALEAVLPAGMLMWVFAGFFQSVVGYSSVFVGQFVGAGKLGRCRVAYRAALCLALASGVLSVPLWILGRLLLAAFTSSDVLLAQEDAYFSITLLGSIFIYWQMAAASYFTGLGRTRIVFWVNLLGNLLNIVLDPLLIFTAGLGIAGAAYATVGAMAVQALVLALAVRREERACSPLSEWTWRDCPAMIWRILRFGVPAGLYSVLNLLSFTIFVFVTEGVGAMELAVSNACFTINYLVFAPMEGFSLGASTLVAQAIGRRDTEGARRAASRTILLGVGFVALACLVILLFAHPILTAFASQAGATSDEFHRLGFTLLLLMTAWQVFDAADVILSGALKGAGDTKFVMGWMLVASFLVWLPLVFLVRQFHNTMPALWATMVFYVIVICTGSVLRWKFGSWRKIRLLS